jgi:predicted acylesterase/phospholipase RssA
MRKQTSRQAVVFSGSGCGSADAYGVGVVKALAEGDLPFAGDAFEPSIYSGSAFGAFNAAVMVSNAGGAADATVRCLEQAWLDGLCSAADRPNGVFRVRCNPLKWLDARAWLDDPVSTVVDTAKDTVYLARDLNARIRANLESGGATGLVERLINVPSATPFFDMAPLQGSLRTYIDLTTVRSSKRALMINATDWEAGIGRIFTNADMTDAQGYDILQASAAYLLVFPFVDIDGRPFGGGPASLATPVRPVIDAWAPRTDRLTVHTIYIHPPMPQIPIGKMPGMFSGMGRYFDMVESLNIRADVEQGSGRATPSTAGRRLAKVTIHRYRPSTPIVDWFGTLDFDRMKTASFIAQGYDDTKNHDCQVAGCSHAD